MLPHVLPVEDDEVSAAAGASPSPSRASRVLTGTKIDEPKVSKKGVKITVGRKDGKPGEALEARDRARGHRRRAGAARRHAEARTRPRLHQDRRRATRPACRASIAAGDIIGPPWLAHVGQLRGGAGRRGHVRARPQAEEGRRLSRAAPIASRRSPASASPSAPRRKKGIEIQGRQIPVHRPAARRWRSARARAL